MRVRIAPRNTASLGPALLVICLTTAIVIPASARQAPARSPQAPVVTPPPPTPHDTLRSPEVGPDGRVIFRLYAPGAREVKLHAEGMEATPNMSPDELKKT